MIIDSGTKRKPRGMNVSGPLDAFERPDKRSVMPLSHAEVVGPERLGRFPLGLMELRYDDASTAFAVQLATAQPSRRRHHRRRRPRPHRAQHGMNRYR